MELLDNSCGGSGALHTHKSLRTQIEGLCQAWEWQNEDRILHALPLHHVHGIINALYCAHNSGACVEFLPKFSPDAVWQGLKVRVEQRAGQIDCNMTAQHVSLQVMCWVDTARL